ncbi:CD109 antigen-like [Seriola dumerili]|uniref:CD109 antigen-like n=1 Tax=Seriola dumerili TaxID=41447 RepID=UPI000BBEEBAC|nr:CD109 antigen-like [Seriola dumerili]
MDGIWTLVLCLGVVCFAVPGSTQDPNRTLFLISGPNVLHAGTPTPLAVTVFAHFPGRVTAELAHGNTSVGQTEDFQGGLTRVLTLPPVPGSVTQNSLLNLTVRGYKGDSLIFSNTTTLSFNLKNVSSVIQTDRSRCQPGDTIRVRVVSVQMDNHPYKGRVDISVRDPSGNVVDRWESTGNLGIVLREFSLSQSAPLGEWAIATTVNGVNHEKTFTVEHHEGPQFEVLVKTPSRVLVGGDISGSLRISRYDRRPLSSQDLMYSAVVEVTQRKSAMNAEPTTLTVPVPEDGNVHIKFKLQDQVEMLFMRARFQSSEETLSVYNNYSSPSGSYIQISPIDTLPAQVSSRGQVVAAGTKNSSPFPLTPTLSWSPEAFVTVYCILSNGEVTSDTAHIPINQHSDLSLKWSSDEAQPGEQVSLTVTTLEPRSQVGIAVMGAHDDGTPEDDQDLKVKQVCDNTWTSGTITVPDGVTSLRAVALVMSDNLGLGFTPVPVKLTVSKDFSLSLNVPSYLIRGEEIVLEVNIINHLDQDIEVIMLLAQSKAFEFVLGDRGDVSVVNAQKLTLGSHASTSALFPIRPVALGVMEISVDAVCAEASDSIVRKVLVKPEGVERFFSETLFLELAPEKQSNTRTLSFSFPPDMVPGSQRAHVALVGDILALSFNLDSLVQMPLGCGEQNMIHFAPSVYVLQYLEKSNLENKEIRSRALGVMNEGYRRQLSYQRDDGSFSAFGASDTSGSTWLTAFVLRCFLQAQPYMQIDYSVLTRAMAWLLKHQGPQGEFSEVGRLIHTEMQGGLDNGPVALTAYVLIALLEEETYSETYPGNVSLAQTYLESQVTGGVVSNYSLCLVAYALVLANSRMADTALSELIRRADNTVPKIQIHQEQQQQ